MTTRQVLRKATLALSLCSAALLSACSGATRSGTSYTLKPDREIEAFLPGDLDKVHKAAEDTVRDDLSYRITRTGKDAREGFVEALTAKGDIVRVETYRSGDKVTRTEIFVGPLGDEEAMRDVLDALTRTLERR
ncbi:MAG: DUF3568 family protein [Planctomycetota bacterium]|nr:DUF3568 family protein [Planctomycetota bacterium]